MKTLKDEFIRSHSEVRTKISDSLLVTSSQEYNNDVAYDLMVILAEFNTMSTWIV
nr:MAG TPA: hypothetical protein [Caudoviricetes sp.]